MPIRVTVWNEFRHEVRNPKVKAIYPEGMHVEWKKAIEEHIGLPVEIRTATLDEPEHGLSDEVLNNTDVLTWWGHGAHAEVSDAVAKKVTERVLDGMGLVVLHSGHYAKPFQMLLGTHAHLKWRDEGERERVWVVDPGHPITRGLNSDCIVIDREEMYGEHFDLPTPDELIFISWFEGGEVFRSGCVWKRGAGKIFYFRPGHELFPTYYIPEIRKVIANGVRYVSPTPGAVAYRNFSPHIVPPLEPIHSNPEAFKK